MMSEEWPIAVPSADPPVEPARPAGSERLASVRRDFFLDPAARLNEQERVLMRAMLEDLIASIADEIVTLLPPGLDAIGEAGHDALIARLWPSGLLDRPVLVALLLRRADEQRLGGNRQMRGGPADPALIQRLVADPDANVAAAAMALVVARGRRRDRFGQGRLLFDDLPAEEAVALTPIVAAALRQPLPPRAAIDRELAAAGQALLARHDEGLRIEAQIAGLVRALDAAGRLDDRLIEEIVGSGDVALASAILAHRAGVPEAMAWDRLCASNDGRFVELARAADIGRVTAARLLAELGATTRIADPAREMARFNAIDDGAVEDLRGEWRLPIGYRMARERLRG